MAYYRMNKKLKAKYEELLKSKEWTEIVAKYMLFRCSGKKTNTKALRIKLAKQFVTDNVDLFPKRFNEDALVKKVSRKLRDQLEESVSPVVDKVKTGSSLVDKEPDEVKPEEIDKLLIEALDLRNKCLAGIKTSLDNLTNVIAAAFFVKEGDIKDKDSKKSKYVGCSWLHALRQEVAQLRGIAGKESTYVKDDEKKVEPQTVPIQVVPVVIPPVQTAPAPVTTPVPDPSWPLYEPGKIWCKEGGVSIAPASSTSVGEVKMAGSVTTP